MEQKHKKILEKLHEKIITDIDVDNGILEFLQGNGILTPEDLININRETTGITKATLLLSILPHRGSRSFDAFFQALKKHYSWLSDEMLKMTSNREESRTCTSPILPIIPSLTVDRAEKVQQLKNAFRELSPGRYVVLHGMKGYGRTRLTASTLTEEIRAEYFNNKIHWIKFGSEGINSVEDEILNQLQQLYDTIENRNVSLNIGKLQGEMRWMLKRHFSTPSHRDSLLILDDAYDQKIIEAFNFDCKTLIITTDTEILPPNYNDRVATIITMSGFTETESLELFARALDTQVELLPPEAKDFHNACKGMPIMVDMFAAQFAGYKEDMKTNSSRWKHYLEVLRKLDSSNSVIQKFLNFQSTTFDICINRLSEDQRKLYESLAIFSEDINIMSKTLGVYWNKSAFDVDDIMTSLHKKSLIVKYWNADLKSLIYGVHDLLLSHLRNRINRRDSQKLRLMHRDFVNKYYDYCKKDYSNLPQDNYSYAYIGYHLDQARMYADFPTLYLNFDFIQAKIRNSGVNDLLIDLKKYRRHIINDETENNVVDLEEFLRAQAKTLAEHRQRDCLDLVQIALNHHTRGYCYKTARSLAQSQKTKLYLKNSHQHFVMHNPTAEDIKMEYSTLNFTDNPHKILIGTKSGLIILWDCELKRMTPFHGLEDSEIVKVIVSENGKFFVALNKDSVIKYFPLTVDDEDDDDDKNDNYWDNHSHTPLDKQTYWYPIVQQPTNNSSITYETNGQVITDIALSSDDEKLAACTSKGSVSVWDVSGKHLTTIAEDTNFQKLTFAKKIKQLHVIDTEGTNFVYIWRDNNYIYNTRYSQFRNLKGSSEEKVVIYFKERIYDSETEYETVLICLTRKNCYIISWGIGISGDLYSPEPRRRYTADNTQFTVATGTYDGKYVIIGNNNNLLSVLKIEGGFTPIANYPEHTFALDTYYDKECDCHLILSGDKHSIQCWTFCPENLPQSVLRPLFDAVMKPLKQSNIVAQEIIGNKIGLYNGEELQIETGVLEGQIISLSLSPEGNKILYTMKHSTGFREAETIEYSIYVFNVETNEISEILSSLTEFPGYVKFIKFHDELAIVCKQNDILYCILDEQKITIRTEGNIVNLHTIKDEYVVGITRDEKVKIWKMNTTAWDLICQAEDTGQILYEIQRSVVLYSAINLEKTMIAILTNDCRLAFYEIDYNSKVSTVPEKLNKYENTYFTFYKKLTCCAFSPNGEILAIGMEDGNITIFDLKTFKAHPKELSLHQNSILQLHWAPSIVGAPILLSINCDELAWWNVALMDDNSKKKIKRSRTGIVKSSTVPTFGFESLSGTQLRNSQTADANLSIASTSKIFINKNKNNNDNILTYRSIPIDNDIDISNGNNAINGNDTRDSTESQETMPKYWISKTYKNQNRPALLGLIRLPPNCRAKVCVSSDFHKFLLVDVHGTIKCFELFEVSSNL
ncbi:uncharacterized protein LOC123275535 isoform X1 [Cotesia glomerata]|uniref:CARD domain-containing protein n=1 Tax=Cotesia glomerata TaxID=32391 RepID=A0AAV7I108_COTGL|nr:uncharacterized protein LOC123275535 isoform X1 [Cotesia glomerata]XP_044599636.1 uncharacterized protein LOC123275535 isoform X1 [Cotesia glomerata]KAH0540718.1 hypothetical protein KQX54_019411 [Cotesia glomerata]